jgi:heme exporter protein D
MLETLKQFFYMGGYGGYVFSAYFCVFGLLASQWFITWRRWLRYLNREKSSS